MRLFTGIPIASDTVTALERLIHEWSPLAALKWAPSENLHVTIKFIGEWPEPRLSELTETLESIKSPGRPTVSVSGFHFYPNPARPHTFVANIEPGSLLPELAQRTEAALAPFFIPREQRAYRPHITLARIKSQRVDLLCDRLAMVDQATVPSFIADRFHLYRSEPGRHASRYTQIATYSL